MNRLFLVRHAKTLIGNSNIPDHDRTISDNGISDIKKISNYLIDNNFIPEYIISSTSVRTLETINILNKSINLKIHTKASLYNAQIKDINETIKIVDKKYNSVMIIGHNPSITDYINSVSNANIDYVPTSGIAIIDFNSDWDSINKNGKLIDFIYPKKLN